MTFQVELWQVILLFITVVAFIIGCIMKHGERLTKVETSSDYICKSLDELKTAVKESTDLLRKHILHEVQE